MNHDDLIAEAKRRSHVHSKDCYRLDKSPCGEHHLCDSTCWGRTLVCLLGEEPNAALIGRLAEALEQAGTTQRTAGRSDIILWLQRTMDGDDPDVDYMFSELAAAFPEDTDPKANNDETFAGGVRRFAYMIMHGSEEHRAWLDEAAEKFIVGQPIPLPTGDETGDQRP